MNKFKGLFNLYKNIPSENIDPYGFIDKDGPWIGGSFALWNFLNKPKWTFNDIDYFVRTPEQADTLLNYFSKISTYSNEIYKNIYKFNCDNHVIQVNANPYQDIRLRLQHADLSHTKIAHNGEEYCIDKMAESYLLKNEFFYTDKTFDLDRTKKRITLYKERGFIFLDKYSL